MNLLDLQDDIVTYLLAQEYFSGLTVINEKSKEILTGVSESVGKAKGLLITVLTVSGKIVRESQSVPGPRIETRVRIAITEQVTVNRASSGTGKPATEIVTELMQALHTWKPAKAQQMLVFESFEPVDDPQFLILLVEFSTKLNLTSTAQN